MKVRLLLDVAPYAVFPVMNELEIEVAAGTYLEQSQVKIMGASADSQNQGKTVVDINLVPLGEKFDNTTATLTYERFWRKKVPLNVTLFGSYEVMYISYPGNNLICPLNLYCFAIILPCHGYDLRVHIRYSFFSTISKLYGEWSKWKCWKSPHYCKFCEQEPEDES